MNESLSSEPLVLTVEARAHGWRVDHYLQRLFPNYSRALFQKAIEQQAVEVNGLSVKSSRRLHVNDVVSVRLPTQPDSSIKPEEHPLDVLFEDEHLIVINKAAGMITHPGKGHSTGTLAAALQFHFDKLSDVAGEERPGIVHRLDRDTSGVIIIAKDNQVHHKLSAQFERREVVKQYVALAWGVVDRDSDWIDTFIRVNPKEREKMTVCEPCLQGRPATTFYEVIERFYDFTWVRLFPKTGRTHQLRVHLKFLGHPIVADRLYGGRNELRLSQIQGSHRPEGKTNRLPNRTSDTMLGVQSPDDTESGISEQPALDPDVLINRQALHAQRISFRHPVSNATMTIEAPIPPDIVQTLSALRETR